MKKIAGALLLVLVYAAHAGEVYTWTDERGRTHFSDKPVPSAKKIVVKTPGGNPGPITGEDPASQRARECQNKKDQLQNYERAEKIVERDSLGKDHEYTPEQRKQLLDRTRQQMDEACKLKLDNSNNSASSSTPETTVETPKPRVENVPAEERAK